MNKNLQYFMREARKSDEIISVPAPDTLVDDNGEPIMLEFKVLIPIPS